MGEADEIKRHRIEALGFRANRVDRDLIGARQQNVLLVRPHRAGAWAITGKGAIHDRENSWMNFALDRQEIDERLVNDPARPVTAAVQ